MMNILNLKIKKSGVGSQESEVRSRKSGVGSQLPTAKRQTPPANNGFTLLEVMIAVSIIAIVLIAVYKLHGQSISMNNAARFHTTAPLLAQSKLSEFGIKSLDELTSDSGDFGDNFPGYTWNVSVEDVQSEFLDSVAENLKRIDVSVNLGEGEFVYKYSFRTYRFVDE